MSHGISEQWGVFMDLQFWILFVLSFLLLYGVASVVDALNITDRVVNLARRFRAGSGS